MAIVSEFLKKTEPCVTKGRVHLGLRCCALHKGSHIFPAARCSHLLMEEKTKGSSIKINIRNFSVMKIQRLFLGLVVIQDPSLPGRTQLSFKKLLGKKYFSVIGKKCKNFQKCILNWMKIKIKVNTTVWYILNYTCIFF